MTNWLNVKNNAESALSAAVTAAATSLTVVPGDGSKFPTSNFNITIDDEIILCTARSGDVLSITRAQEGTTAAIHAAGAIVALNVTAGVISQLQTGKNMFVPCAVASELWRNDAPGASSFEALIDTVNSTIVVYKSEVRAASLPAFAYASWGRVYLRNVTRGTSRLITGVNLGTKTITTVASSDAWAANDIITIGSATCVAIPDGYTYSGFFDIDISIYVPATATAILIEGYSLNQSASAAGGQNSLCVHPFDTFADGKACFFFAAAVWEWTTGLVAVPVYSQKICVKTSTLSPAAIMILRIRGYWE